MIRPLGRFFIMGFFLTLGFGLFGDYAWDMVLFTAVALGFYMPLTLVSITTWRAIRGEDPEDMVTVFGRDAPEVISAFHEIYRRNKTAVLATTVLTWLACGGLMGLWVSWALPGAWSKTPGLLLTLTAGVSLCGAIAGPGLAIVVLSFLKNASGSIRMHQDQCLQRHRS